MFFVTMILKCPKKVDAMKQIYGLLCLIILASAMSVYSLMAKDDYHENIEQNAHIWKKTYIDTLSNSHHTETLIDLILLSYFVAQESCKMILAKLTIQEELCNIYTPSLSESWQTNMQISKNDTKKLEYAVESIKQSQIAFQELFSKLKIIGPQLLQVNPQPTQTLITDLKSSLISWGKKQQEVTDQLMLVQNEFSLAIATISDIKTLFDTDFHKHVHLKEAAQYVSKTYSDIESVMAHLTKIRKESIKKIELFFSMFFKTYYSEIYNSLSIQQRQSFSTLATSSGKLPQPDAFFL